MGFTRQQLLHRGKLVNVLRDQVPVVKSAAAALDARPLGRVAAAEVDAGVGRAGREAEAEAGLSVDSPERIKGTWAPGRCGRSDGDVKNSELTWARS